jgi:hypothetical protein
MPLTEFSVDTSATLHFLRYRMSLFFKHSVLKEVGKFVLEWQVNVSS